MLNALNRGYRVKYDYDKILRCFTSQLSTNYTFVDIEKRAEKIYSINLRNKPVNALGLEFMVDIANALKELERNDDCKAVMFVSNLETFSAGFQSNELLTQDLKRMESFWSTAQNLGLSILKTPLITASAVEGSCIAGGCYFPFLSDISVMSSSDKLRIGIAATRMGIVPPKILLLPLQNLVGFRKAEFYASRSILLKPEEAHKCGMIQTVVPRSEVLKTAINQINLYLQIPESGLLENKRLFNAKILQEIDNESFLKAEVKDFCDRLQEPETQQKMQSHFDKFSKRN
uniref:Uncharacterized protein n=1 Tax=Clytia hemisphaerica TaxID=252671 RepID=A0A7M5XAJ3_9CNID|eukprot:TCONS_00056399-protein